MTIFIPDVLFGYLFSHKKGYNYYRDGFQLNGNVKDLIYEDNLILFSEARLSKLVGNANVKLNIGFIIWLEVGNISPAKFAVVITAVVKELRP